MIPGELTLMIFLNSCPKCRNREALLLGIGVILMWFWCTPSCGSRLILFGKMKALLCTKTMRWKGKLTNTICAISKQIYRPRTLMTNLMKARK